MLLVLCHLRADSYAVRASCVHEVVPLVLLHRVAHAPLWHAGLLIHRGQATPVVDFAQLAGQSPAPPRLSSRIVIVEADLGGQPRRFGLLAERVDLREVESRLGHGAGEAANRTRWGRLVLESGSAYELVELDRLLPAEQWAAMFPSAGPGC